MGIGGAIATLCHINGEDAGHERWERHRKCLPLRDVGAGVGKRLGARAVGKAEVLKLTRLTRTQPVGAWGDAT